MAEEVEQKDALKTGRPTNALFEKAFDYKTYRLANSSDRHTPYMEGHLHRSKKKVDACMSQKWWNVKDRAVILNFRDNFRRACNDCGVHEGIGMMLFKYYVKDTAWKILKDRI